MCHNIFSTYKQHLINNNCDNKTNVFYRFSRNSFQNDLDNFSMHWLGAIISKCIILL
jgi:hypothetical protein